MIDSDTINLQYTTIKDPLPDFIWEGLKEYSRNANGYKPQPQELVEKLALKHHLPREMIFLTSGIDEAIQMFAMAYGENAFVFVPTYSVYADVEEFGGKLTRISSMEGTEFKVATAQIPDATLIYLANPNNPCGFTSKDKVLELVKNNSHAIVVVDEAYAEFNDFSVIDKVKSYPNLVVFRSFSKAYGMAGNRIAFFVASSDIIKKVKNKTTWANVSYLSVGAAIVALDHEEYFNKIIEAIKKRREEFILFLKENGFTFFSSKINGVLLKFASEQEGISFVSYLKQNNIVVSHGNANSNIGLDLSFVRIAIGNEKQMEKVQSVAKKYRQDQILRND